MARRTIAFWSIIFSAFVYSCGTDLETQSIAGDYTVDLFQIINCNDSTSNQFFVFDSSNCFQDTFSNREICITDFVLSFTDGGTYKIERSITIDGQASTISEMGDYTNNGTNDIILCHSQCDDAFFVRDSVNLRFSRMDSISGCGTFIRATVN